MVRSISMKKLGIGTWAYTFGPYASNPVDDYKVLNRWKALSGPLKKYNGGCPGSNQLLGQPRQNNLTAGKTAEEL
jgi:hypothetical protein